jgi:hypothetical protein
MATHLIHKSSDKITRELEQVNLKLDQMLKSDALEKGLAAIVKELSAIKDKVGKLDLPKDVEKALRKLPKKLDNIAEEIEDCCDCWEDKTGDIKLADIGTSTDIGKALAKAGIKDPKDLVGTSAESSKAVARAIHQKIMQATKGSNNKIPSRKQILLLVIEARAKLKPALKA